MAERSRHGLHLVTESPAELVLDLSGVHAVDEDGMEPIREADVVMCLRQASLRPVDPSPAVAHLLTAVPGEAGGPVVPARVTTTRARGGTDVTAAPVLRPVRTGRSDYAELSSRIRAAGLLDRRTGYYVARYSLTWLVFAAGWLVFALDGASWWQLVTAAVLGVLSTQVAFLGHDAGHKQVARTRRGSYLLGLLHGNLAVGLSFGWWLDKHNRHHAHPNHAELDLDVAPTGPLIFFPEDGAGRRGLFGWVTRHQAVVFFPLLALEGLNLHVASLQALRSGTIRARWLETGLLAVHLAAFVAAPLLLLTPWQAVAFIAVHQAVFGFYMGCSFAPNHNPRALPRRSAAVAFGSFPISSPCRVATRWRGGGNSG